MTQIYDMTTIDDARALVAMFRACDINALCYHYNARIVVMVLFTARY